MRSTIVGRTRLALPGAALLSLLLVGQTLAVSWSSPIPLTSSGNGWAGGLVTLGASTAVAIYEDGGRVFVRRSTDSGVSWAPRLRLTTDGESPAIAARGSKVDAVWEQGGRVRYARSTDSGASFGASRTLSPSPEPLWPFDLAVARGPNGRVAVAWVEAQLGFGDAFSRVRVRVSRDGGATFDKAKTLARGSTTFYLPSVAVGKGVIYVAYSSESRLRLRRSLDSGATWKAATTITSQGDGASLTASGSQAHIAYSEFNGSNTWVRTRRTTDKGKTWASPINLSSATGKPSYSPRLSLQGGVVRAAFERCLDSSCNTSGVFYRQSSNGTSWTSAEKVSTDAGRDAHPAGVGFAGRVIVLYGIHVGLDGYLDPNVYVRSGAP
jgi:hypothetical protein